MSKQFERRALILETLKHKAKLNTTEVVELLNVSESTARRLFSDLERQGKVLRNYGGIQLANNNHIINSFEQLAKTNIEEKIRIASYGAEMVEDHEIIYIDSGSTMYQFSIALAEKIKNGKIPDVKILTNSMANHQILAPISNVILIGGEYRPRQKDFAGYVSNRVIQLFSFTKSFLGADAVNLTDGLMVADADTASLVEIAIKRSKKIVILADSSKLEKLSFVSYAPLEKVDELVTSEGTDDGIINDFKKVIPSVHLV